jgi:hypothetical protein
MSKRIDLPTRPEPKGNAFKFTMPLELKRKMEAHRGSIVWAEVCRRAILVALEKLERPAPTKKRGRH